MKKIPKLLIIDPDGKYLLLNRSDHPVFGQDPDLPGGTSEQGESSTEALLREVREEIGLSLNLEDVTELHHSTEYSPKGNDFILFIAKLKFRPQIKLSWEHSKYDWLNRDEFISLAQKAKDSYMHMVGDFLSRDSKAPN